MLFSKKIEPSCSYCRLGRRISDEEVACIKKGVVSSGASCRRFKYDPLLREPSEPALIKSGEFSPDDFTL
ncbi:MAG: hypothetical protein IKI49_01830 [Oscillospiraceae bacterium]|nr:hypothetical protein [Oscillospiraceae bacterium]